MFSDDSQESRPLLFDAARPHLDSEVHDQPQILSDDGKRTPFPIGQLFVLCFLRILDPMSFSQIFPYINEFVHDLHMTNDPSKIGFYSGLLESSFAICQLLTIYPWGYFSDRSGRRPAVLIGIAGLTFSTILFGFSSSFTFALIVRGIAGLFSGNVAVIPCILAEITDENSQAFAYPFFGLWWPVGATLGPLIGGILSKPASRYPTHFDTSFFRTNPYALPCLLVSFFSAIGLIVSWLFLKETLPDAGKRKNNPSFNEEESYKVNQLLCMPIIRALCASGCSLSFISTAFDVIFVLFCYTPISKGGLSFSTSEIGFALSTAGCIAALLQVFFMPTVLRRLNHAAVYHFCMKIWPCIFIILPILNVVARHGVIQGSEHLESFTVYALWFGIILILCAARVAFLAYSARVNMLLIKQFAPNSASLGSSTGLVQFSICLSRAFSPAFASSLFALSINNGLLRGYIWAIIMAFIGFTGSIFSRKIVGESQK